MNVLVLSLNDLQLGYVGCFGNPWIQTPALDRLAAESLVFDRYFSASVDPRGARLTSWTGRYRSTPESAEEDSSCILLAETLSDAGIRTALISDAACLAGSPALLRGFHDVVTELPSQAGGPARLFDAAVNWLESGARSDPFLLWLDADALRPPWEPPEPFASMYDEALDDDPESNDADPVEPDALEIARYRYAAQVSYADACVGQLLDQLYDRGDEQTTAIILLSDRGMPLGEHGVMGSATAILYEELVHVPLVIRMPDLRGAGARTAALAQPVDLAPTILALFELSPIGTMHGACLVPLFERTGANVRNAAVAGIPGQAWSLRTPEWHFITPTESQRSVVVSHESPPAQCPHKLPELYLKPEDRWDQHNVAAMYPDDVDRLTHILEQVAQGIAEARIDETAAILRALSPQDSR